MNKTKAHKKKRNTEQFKIIQKVKKNSSLGINRNKPKRQYISNNNQTTELNMKTTYLWNFESQSHKY